MLRSDWLIPNFLRSDWLQILVACNTTHGNEISVNKRVHERITSDEIEADTNLLICIKLRQIEYYF